MEIKKIDENWTADKKYVIEELERVGMIERKGEKYYSCCTINEEVTAEIEDLLTEE